jgi:hypothetical protein
MPLGCRIGFHHVWRTESTEDGQRYRRCRRCGRDHPGLGSVKGGLGVGVPFSNY